MTASEARARRKTLAGPKLSREERRADKAANRARMSERRERMMAGEEGYLLPRDQGPVRRYVRDIVDSRRNLLGLFMPSTLFLMFIMFGVPQLQLYISPAMLVLMAVMSIDGLLLGRKVSRMVDAKFPDNTESRWKLGLYAAGRASQMRRLRAPRPQVKHGSSVD
ncbi:membrane protein [Mycobacterium avium 10-5560]|nr:membrane protein [Mycobacterium avium 10-5560]